jgi:hypothetical protein
MIRQTKFYLVAAAFIVSAIALFVGRCTFVEWASFMGTLFALYGLANVTDTHLQQKKSIPLESQTS